MKCVLRVYGKVFDVDQFLTDSPWHPNPIHRRGEERRLGKRRLEPHKQSGFVIRIPGSDTPGEVFADQASAVLAFLGENQAEFLRLSAFPGVETCTLDFAVPLYEHQPMRSNHMPIELVRAAAALSIALEVTVYACSSEAKTE